MHIDYNLCEYLQKYLNLDFLSNRFKEKLYFFKKTICQAVVSSPTDTTKTKGNVIRLLDQSLNWQPLQSLRCWPP